MKGRDSRTNLFEEGGIDASIDDVTSIGGTEGRNEDLIILMGPITRSRAKKPKARFQDLAKGGKTTSNKPKNVTLVTWAESGANSHNMGLKTLF